MKQRFFKIYKWMIVALSACFFSTVLVPAGLRKYKLWNVKLPSDFNICFTSDTPGAGDRYQEYTFFSCSGRKTKLASKSSIGADWGDLNFDDVDNDGVAEIIVESHAPWWNGACIDEERSIYKLHPEPPLKITLLRREWLGNVCDPAGKLLTLHAGARGGRLLPRNVSRSGPSR